MKLLLHNAQTKTIIQWHLITKFVRRRLSHFKSTKWNLRQRVSGHTSTQSMRTGISYLSSNGGNIGLRLWHTQCPSMPVISILNAWNATTLERLCKKTRRFVTDRGSLIKRSTQSIHVMTINHVRVPPAFTHFTIKMLIKSIRTEM